METKFYELDEEERIKVETINPKGMKKRDLLIALERLMWMGVDGSHCAVYLGVCKLFPKIYFEKSDLGERAQKLYDHAEKQGYIQGGTPESFEYMLLPELIVEKAPRGYKKILEEVVWAT